MIRGHKPQILNHAYIWGRLLSFIIRGIFYSLSLARGLEGGSAALSFSRACVYNRRYGIDTLRDL